MKFGIKAVIFTTCFLALTALLTGCDSSKTNDSDKKTSQEDEIGVPPVPPEPSRPSS